MLSENLISNLEKSYHDFFKRKPNPINVLNSVSIKENHHTEFLAEILRSRKTFLKSFLASIFEDNLDNFDDFSEIETQKHRIDTLLTSNKKAIIIESKACGAIDKSKQIQTYIEKLKGCYPFENIYVIYLTLTGGAPSLDSLPDALKTELGSRYEEINYLNDILPWLKNDVLPECHYKEQSLIFSIELYIEYLNRSLGINENMSELAKILTNQLNNDNICSYDEIKSLLKEIQQGKQQEEKQKILSEAINIVLREMERGDIYLNEESVAYNLKWLLKNKPTAIFKNYWRIRSFKPFTSIGRFTYGGHKYIQLATHINDSWLRIHLCCTIEGIKNGPYLLADKKPISEFWDIEYLKTQNFTGNDVNLCYPFNAFTTKLPLTDVAKHIENMITILNKAKK